MDQKMFATGGKKGGTKQKTLPAEKKLLYAVFLFINLFAAYYIVLFILLALFRITFPGEYEWMEGFHMVQVHRLLSGKPLYAEPTLEYVPIMYGPIYPYISCFFARLLGEHYGVLRLVSILSTLGTLYILGRMVWRKTGSFQAAWTAAGLYAGMYGATGFYYDLARVDSLHVFLATAAAFAIWVAAENGGKAVPVAAAVAVCAALTKQTALVPIAGLCILVVAEKYPKGLTTALVCTGALLASHLVPALTGNNWFYYYLYKVPSAHHLSMDNLNAFLYETARYLLVGLVLSILAIIALLKAGDKKDARFLSVFFLTMLIAGILPRLKIGGATNNLMPIAAAISACCGAAAGVMRNVKSKASTAVFVLLVVFNIQVLYKPAGAIPGKKVLELRQADINVLRTLKTPVFAPCHPYLAVLAGKNMSAFWMPIYDMAALNDGPARLFFAKLRQALEEKRFGAVVLPKRFIKRISYLSENYMPVAPLVSPKDRIMTRLVVYVPKPDGG